jgi:hypothetical protein
MGYLVLSIFSFFVLRGKVTTAVYTANYDQDRIDAVVLKQPGVPWLNQEANSISRLCLCTAIDLSVHIIRVHYP